MLESGCVSVSDLIVTQPSWTESGVRTGVCSHCLPLNMGVFSINFVRY